MSLVSRGHSVGQSLYHFEWCPKYRYNMFRGDKNKRLCETILREVAERHGIELVELSVMPDHVHAIVSIPPTMTVSRAFNLLKGASSRQALQTSAKVQVEVPERTLLESR